MNQTSTGNPRNEVNGVQNTLVELYRDAVQLLRGRKVLVSKRSKFSLDDGTFHMDEKDEFMWKVLIHEAREEFSRLESFARVKYWLENDAAASKHLGKMVGIDERRHGVNTNECVKTFLAELFNDAKGLEFDEENGRAKADEFVAFFGRDTIVFDCVALIENFNCPRDEVDLGDGLRIQRWSAEERSDLLAHMDTSLSFRDAGTLMRGSEFVLSLMTEESKVIHEQDDAGDGGTKSSRHVHERFSDACVALSVFGTARIKYHGISRIAKSWVPGGRAFHPSTSGRGPVIGGQRREFTDEEIDGFLAFWPKIQQSSPSLQVGIRWLNHLLGSHGSYEDHLIRAAIVLESTLLHNLKEELTYRLRLRGARLLAGRNRKETYQFLGALYDQRSKIVHEGKGLPERLRIGRRDYNGGELVKEITSLCRDVVVTLIDAEASGVSLRDLLQRLDDEALLGSTEHIEDKRPAPDKGQSRAE